MLVALARLHRGRRTVGAHELPDQPFLQGSQHTTAPLTEPATPPAHPWVHPPGCRRAGSTCTRQTRAACLGCTRLGQTGRDRPGCAPPCSAQMAGKKGQAGRRHIAGCGGAFCNAGTQTAGRVLPSRCAASSPSCRLKRSRGALRTLTCRTKAPSSPMVNSSCASPGVEGTSSLGRAGREWATSMLGCFRTTTSNVASAPCPAIVHGMAQQLPLPRDSQLPVASSLPHLYSSFTWSLCSAMAYVPCPTARAAARWRRPAG